MVTDYWPQEEGYIVEGSPVMMCQTGDTIVEMACVKITGSTAGHVLVDHSAAACDSIGVCLRACTVTGQMVPVAFGGVVKMTSSGAFGVQEPVGSTGTDTSQVVALLGAHGSDDLYFNEGTAWMLGHALHAAAGAGDDILILLDPH